MLWSRKTSHMHSAESFLNIIGMPRRDVVEVWCTERRFPQEFRYRSHAFVMTLVFSRYLHFSRYKLAIPGERPKVNKYTDKRRSLASLFFSELTAAVTECTNFRLTH